MNSTAKRPDLSSDEAHTSTQAEFTAQEQYQYLQEAVGEWGVNPENANADIAQVEEALCSQKIAQPSKRSSHRVLAAFNKPSLIIKSALALAIAFALGWTPVQRFFATTSTEAIINAPLITLRAPISGQLSLDSADLAAGAKVHAGQSIFTIVNSRATSAELDNLKREVGQFETTIMTLKAKRDVLQSQRAELYSLQKQYKQGRLQSLKKQVAAVDAQIDSAQAQRREAQRVLTRVENLFGKGVATQAALGKARRDAIVANRAVSRLKEQKGELEVAQNFAEKGVFINDGYNDTPVSVQRLLDLEVELAGLEANITGATRQLSSARHELVTEQERQSRMAVAKLKIAAAGRIWDVMVTPHEHVNAGQVLMHILDCNDAHVTASVSKAVYEKLLIGQGATFKADDGSPTLKGWIAGLNGLAIVRTNEAIQPNMLSRALYHVTLDFPGLRKQVGCRVGRSGSVDFDTSDRTIRAIANVDGAR